LRTCTSCTQYNIYMHIIYTYYIVYCYQGPGCWWHSVFFFPECFYISYYIIYDPERLTMHICCVSITRESNNNACNVITVSRCTFSAAFWKDMRLDRILFCTKRVTAFSDLWFCSRATRSFRIEFRLDLRRPNMRVQQRTTTVQVGRGRNWGFL